MKLTNKEQAAYNYITEYIKQHGYSPTTREISLALGYKSQRTGSKYLERLKEKGYINYTTGLGRTIVLVK